MTLKVFMGFYFRVNPFSLGSHKDPLRESALIQQQQHSCFTRTLLMHLTSRVTQASLPTEQSPNFMTMQSITQKKITTALDPVPCSSPQTTLLLLSVTCSQTFLTNESLPIHPWFFWQKKKKPCAISITLRDSSNNWKTALTNRVLLTESKGAVDKSLCWALPGHGSCREPPRNPLLQLRDRAGSQDPPYQVFHAERSLAILTECQPEADLPRAGPSTAAPLCTQKAPGEWLRSPVTLMPLLTTTLYSKKDDCYAFSLNIWRNNLLNTTFALKLWVYPGCISLRAYLTLPDPAFPISIPSPFVFSIINVLLLRIIFKLFPC